MIKNTTRRGEWLRQPHGWILNRADQDSVPYWKRGDHQFSSEDHYFYVVEPKPGVYWVCDTDFDDEGRCNTHGVYDNLDAALAIATILEASR